MGNRFSIPYHLLRQIFHYKEVAQHNQWYFYNRQYKLSESIEEDRLSYIPLNTANALLIRYCEELVKPMNASSSSVFTTLNKTIEKWKNALPFDSFQFLNQIAADLKKSNVDLAEVVSKRSDIVDAFINVPSNVKSFFQFNFFVNDKKIEEWFIKFANSLNEKRYLTCYLKEMTIYQGSYKNVVFAANHYNMIRIKLRSEKITNLNDTALENLSQIFTSELHELTFDQKTNTTLFAKELSRNIYLSQGNTNYKYFLLVLGVINKVYHPDWNYAFQHQPDNTTRFPN